MRTKTIFTLGCGLLTLVNFGCGWFGSSHPSGGVAVVDLDEVARQVGADGEIAQAVQARETSLNSQLKVMKATYVHQLKERKNLYGENPTEAQSEQLVSINRQFNLNLATAQQKASQHLSSHRSQLILKFREQVGPVAEEIAQQKGLSIVVPKNEGWLLAVDEDVDITMEVADALKQQWNPIVNTVPAESPQVATGTGSEQPRTDPGVGGANPVQPAGFEQPVQNPELPAP